MKWAVMLCVLSACAKGPLSEARRMGLDRHGGIRATEVHLLTATVEAHFDAPLTLPRHDALVVPERPPVDETSLAASAQQALVETGADLGITVADGPSVRWTDAWPDDLPTALQALLDDGGETGLAVRVHVGWCPVPSGFAACVRSPDTALGEGPPAVEGVLYGRLKQKDDGAVARRTTVILKRFRYHTHPSGAHLDKPWIGVGETWQTQAEDAVNQALSAWMVRYAGRRGQAR